MQAQEDNIESGGGVSAEMHTSFMSLKAKR